MGLNDPEPPIEFIGLYQGFPIAYAGFEMCPCRKILIWRHIYVPVPLRKSTRVGLTFMQKMCKILHSSFKECEMVEVYLHQDDKTMDALSRYYGVRPLYSVGVLSLGQIAERR